jgi:hypothetical protein
MRWLQAIGHDGVRVARGECYGVRRVRVMVSGGACRYTSLVMRSMLVHLVLAVLLAVQGVLSLAPGRMLCIPLRACDQHQEVPALCGHCDDSHGDAHAMTSPRWNDAAEQFCFAIVARPSDECGCHLHVPGPQDSHVVTKTSGDACEWKHSLALWAAAFVLASQPASADECDVPRPPDLLASMQVRVLRTSRLII